MLKYHEEEIKSILTALDNLDVKGIENAKRIAYIAQVLLNPAEIKEDDRSNNM